MASKQQPVSNGLQITVLEEANLIRVGLSGEASMREVPGIRSVQGRLESSQLPVLVVDDGLTFVDTVAYGSLVQWAQAVRNRNVGWVMATTQVTAGRMFHMGNLNPQEVLHTSEDAARKALDRGKAGQRVAVVSRQSLAIEGLRHK